MRIDRILSDQFRCLFQTHNSMRDTIDASEFKFVLANLVDLGAALRTISQPGPSTTKFSVIYAVGPFVVTGTPVTLLPPVRKIRNGNTCA
jgi:hypothetical protein